MKENQYKSITDFVNSYVDELKADSPKFSGNLANSYKTNVTETSTGFEIDVTGEFYGLFVDRGVNGTEQSYGSPYTFKKRPPISAMLPLANSIGANPYALSNSIFKNGIRPRGYITNNIDKSVNDFGNAMAEALWQDFYDENKDQNTK